LHNFSDLIGIPYIKNGKDINGFDCFGLVQEIYRRLGFVIPNLDYNDPDDVQFIDTLANNEKDKLTKQISKPEPYCFVLLMTVGTYVTHIGVVLEDCKSFIHTTKKKNVCVEKLDNVLWKQKIKEFRKWKNFN